MAEARNAVPEALEGLLFVGSRSACGADDAGVEPAKGGDGPSSIDDVLATVVGVVGKFVCVEPEPLMPLGGYGEGGGDGLDVGVAVGGIEDEGFDVAVELHGSVNVGPRCNRRGCRGGPRQRWG